MREWRGVKIPLKIRLKVLDSAKETEVSHGAEKEEADDELEKSGEESEEEGSNGGGGLDGSSGGGGGGGCGTGSSRGTGHARGSSRGTGHARGSTSSSGSGGGTSGDGRGDERLRVAGRVGGKRAALVGTDRLERSGRLRDDNDGGSAAVVEGAVECSSGGGDVGLGDTEGGSGESDLRRQSALWFSSRDGSTYLGDEVAHLGRVEDHELVNLVH